MKDVSNVMHGICPMVNGGLDCGGWVTQIDIADDGTMVSCNDTTPGAIRGPTDTQWREVFVPGVNITKAEGYASLWKNPARRTVGICIYKANSSILYSSTGGFLWKSTDGALTWVKQTGYKAGAIDITMTTVNDENYRVTGQRMRISPTNSNHVGYMHSDDGLYYTLDGGTTWQLNASVPAPTSHRGGCVHFVSDTDVWVVSNGNLARHSTTGIGGTFATVASGPSVCSSIASGGGNVYFIGDGTPNDSQLYKYSGGAFSQPSGVTGMNVVVNPNDTTKVYSLMVGGGIWTSTDTGGTWNQTTYLYAKKTDDVPYLGRSNSSYFALGSSVFHPTLNRIIMTNGIGVFYLDSPPGTAGSKLVSIGKGIRQMLPHDIVISPNGTVMVPVEDKCSFIFSRANVKQQAATQTPDNTLTLRHGGKVDYARDNENYLAQVYAIGAVGSISTDGGKTWSAMPSIPTMSRYDSGTGITTPGSQFYGGDLAVSNAGNMVWVSSSNSGGGTSIGGVKYTLDGANTWADPIFGAGIDMTGANWHHAFFLRRRIVQADKNNAGVFYLFCNGLGTGSAADIAMTGTWKSVDGGQHFTKIRDGHFSSFSTDFWQSKLKINFQNAQHQFWIQGPTNNYPTAPYAGGVYFTNNEWTNTYALSGFSEPEDVAFGAPAPGRTMASIYMICWIGGVFGVWACFDFNPATRAGTWVLMEEFLNGKFDSDNVIGADPTVFGRYVVGMASGGIAVGDYVDYEHAT